jgi:UDP-2-acetamido-3-amino-2,3-dideoxy-glucuronate N-acetyltransferase
MTRIALIGSGYWGKNFARVLAEKKVLAAICDTDTVSAEPIADKAGVPLIASFDQVLQDASIPALFIATPAATHYQMVRSALLAGKDVFVEKPLALDAAEALELADFATRGGRILMIGHLLQYHPCFQRIAEMVAAGDLGKLSYVHSHRLNFGKLRREENVVWSFAPHDVSMILALAGEAPAQVRAFAHTTLQPGIADTATIQMTFPSGLRAHVLVSWLNPFKEQKLVVTGDKGMLVFDDTLPWAEKLVLYRHRVGWQDGTPVAEKADGERVAVRQGEPLSAEVDHFLACVADRSQPKTDAAEAVRVLTVLTRAQASIDWDKQ